MNLWRIELNNGDWYLWFAKGKRHALFDLRNTHYCDSANLTEFLIECEPRTRQLPDNELVAVEVDGDIQTRTAAEWCKGQSGGPFSSNTYE